MANKPLGPTDLKRLNRQWRRRTENTTALMLCALSNPYNTGSIFRTASVFGVETVYLVGATPSPADDGVQKMAMGTDRNFEIVRIDDMKSAVAQVREEGWAPVALELTDDAVPLHEVKLASATCFVVGNEAHGLPPYVSAACDSTVFIPQPGKTASLNVAVSTAVALYEMRRQEWSTQ